MRLPSAQSEYTAFVRYGRYVSRRLRRAGLVTLAQDVEKATLEVKTAGRAWEDADEPIQDALAERDAADDDLDTAAQTLRNSLAGRGVGADRQEPYTLVFARGISYYTAAPLDEEASRYNELRLRIKEHLPADDSAAKAALTGIDQGLTDFEAAVGELRDVQAREALAGTRARSAINAFQRQLEKTYGVLMAERGKAEAERFFPKIRGSRAGDEGVTPTPS